MTKMNETPSRDGTLELPFGRLRPEQVNASNLRSTYLNILIYYCIAMTEARPDNELPTPSQASGSRRRQARRAVTTLWVHRHPVVVHRPLEAQDARRPGS